MVAAALAITALAGCSVIQRYALSEAAPAPAERGIEGNWLSTDGSSETRFSNGTFQTAAIDTGKTLAEGAYTMTEANVSITMNSLIRRRTSKVNCLLVNAGQLNCTTEDRRGFVLTRAFSRFDPSMSISPPIRHHDTRRRLGETVAG